MMNIRNIALLLAFSRGLLACGAKVVDLDAGLIESSSEPGVLALVHERIDEIAVDEERVYWSGNRWPWSGDGPWFLQSCQKSNCASTLITYDATPRDPRFTYLVKPNQFLVKNHQIYWIRFDESFLISLFSCDVAGCNGAPRPLSTELSVFASAFDDDYFYFSTHSTISRASLRQPGLPELVLQSPGAPVAIAIRGAYIYWVAADIERLDQGQLLRARKDDASSIESIATNLKASSAHELAIAADETSVYWTNNLLSGSINRCPFSGCDSAPEAMLAPLRAPQNLLIDGARLYYQFEARPYEYALSSCTLPACGASEQLQEHLDAPSVLALDDRYLYIATTGQDLSPNNADQDAVARIRQLPKPDRESP